MGSMSNSVMMGYYPVMRQYRDARVADGLSGDGIMIDRCLVDEVVSLWKANIRTYGNCCGHNIPGVRPMINIDPDDMDKAIALGYEVYRFENEPERRDTIIPKSVTNDREQKADMQSGDKIHITGATGKLASFNGKKFIVVSRQ